MIGRKAHSTCMICLQKPKEEKCLSRIAKLDTGSSVNVMSHKVFCALDMEMDDYDGPPLKPLGKDIIIPMGQVKVDWHVSQRTTTYTNKFVILDDSVTKDIDILLCDKTIEETSFYIRNDAVWILGMG